jgi:hypothetical protein
MNALLTLTERDARWAVCKTSGPGGGHCEELQPDPEPVCRACKCPLTHKLWNRLSPCPLHKWPL